MMGRTLDVLEYSQTHRPSITLCGDGSIRPSCSDNVHVIPTTLNASVSMLHCYPINVHSKQLSKSAEADIVGAPTS